MVIGHKGDLPWHFPSDLKFFKEKTAGHTVLMGRVTYESILRRLGKPLPNRYNIVLTRDAKFEDERVTIVRDLSSAMAAMQPDEWGYVIGGAQIYQAAMPYADRLYLTHIDQEITGDAFFPAFDAEHWQLTEVHEIVENSVDLRFCTYQRLGLNPAATKILP